MDTILGELKWEDCLLYLDDLLVYSDTFEKHIERLEKVFTRLLSNNVKLKPSKCQFFKKSVEFLGHVISQEGMKPNGKKVDAVIRFKVPKTVKQLQSFLGLVNYYRKYIANVARVSKPLYNLLQKGVKWKWGQKEQGAFDSLKTSLTSSPVLAFFDPNLETVVKTDASGYAVGAILAQIHPEGERVVQYFSKVLNRYQRNYSTVEQEGLAILHAFKEFKPYLDGKKFKVYTDNAALTYLKTMQSQNKRLERWALYLQQFDFEIIHKKGALNTDVDCLSRYPQLEERMSNEYAKLLDEGYEKYSYDERMKLEIGDEEEEGLVPLAFPVEVEQLNHISEIIQEQKKDNFCKMITARIRGKVPVNGFLLIDGVLHKLYPTEDNMRPVVVIPKPFQKPILQSIHDGGLGMHLGTQKTLKKLIERFWWRSLKSEVAKYVATCRICQEIKSSAIKQQGLLKQSQPIGPWVKLHIDFTGPWPESEKGNKYIIAVQDSFSKWLEIKAVPTIDAKATADFLMNRIIYKWGAPLELVSDRGQQFLSKTVQELCQMMGVKQLLTAPFSPRCNGQIENAHKSVKNMIESWTNQSRSDWDVNLKQVQFAYNVSCSASTDFSPYFVITGRDPRFPDEVTYKRHIETAGEIDEYAMDKAREALKIQKLVISNIKLAQRSQEFNYNKNRTDSKFEIGDKVFIKRHYNKREKGRDLWEVIEVFAHGNTVRIKLGEEVKVENINNLKRVKLRENEGNGVDGADQVNLDIESNREIPVVDESAPEEVVRRYPERNRVRNEKSDYIYNFFNNQQDKVSSIWQNINKSIQKHVSLSEK